MTVTPDEAKDRVSRLEHSLDFVNFRLTANEKILEEIKEAVKQLVVLHQEQHAIKDDLNDLRRDFEERRIKTDPVIEKAHTTISKVYAVASVMGLVFTLVAWIGVGSIQRITALEARGNSHDTAIQVLNTEVRQYHKQRQQ